MGTNVKFASLQYELNKVNLGDKARRVRVIWDKGWHGGNQAKGKCEEEDKLCNLCSLPDSERHWIIGCAHEDCVLIRTAAQSRITELSDQIDVVDEDAKALADTIADWAFEREDGHKIWTGLWSAELIQALDLKLALGVMDKSKVEHLQATALSIGRVLADATLELWETKIRKGKRTETGIDKFTKKLAAAALLRRTKEKRKRDDTNKAAHVEQATKKHTHTHTHLKPSETVKLAFKLATWFNKIPANLTLNEYTAQYTYTHQVDRAAGGGGRSSTLSTSLVRGRLC